MARSPYPFSDRDLLQRIARSAGGKAGYKQLIRELGLGGGRERRLLVEQLTRMVARGDLRSPEEGAWSLPRRADESARSRTSTQSASHAELRSGRDRLVSGRLDMHRDGYGFVRPEQGAAAGVNARPEDIFIPPNEINGAMQGDMVLVDEAPPGRDGRRSGRIARVLARRNPTVVGIFHYAQAGRRSLAPASSSGAPEGNFVTPFEERLGTLIEIPEGAEQVDPSLSPHRTFGSDREGARTRPRDERWPLEGMAVDVEILSFPASGRPARGSVIEVLGHPDDFGVDVEIVIRKHHLPHTFPPPVLEEAEERAGLTPASLETEELSGLEDFRGLPIITIDGETARDFDDAVLVRRGENGHTELQVHIADVSRYVLPGSPLDTEARVRGTSVYFPDRAVPMLPHALSSGMCSLRPEEDRFVLSCVMQIDDEGEVSSYRLAEGLMRSVRRCTYTSVQSCVNASPLAGSWNGSARVSAADAPDGEEELGSPGGPGGAKRPRRQRVTPEATAEDLAERERIGLEQPELPSAIDAMLQLALKLNRKRVRRGSIDFDLPEPVVQFDPDGNMKAIVRSERGWAHRLIEEFMLSANECVATWLENAGVPSIYRIHEMPDPKRIVEFEEAASAFGQTLGLGALPVRKLTMKSDRREAQRQSTRGRGAAPTQTHELPQSIPVTPQMYQRLVSRIAGRPEERILAYMMLRSLKQARYAERNEGHFALASRSYTHFTSPIRRYPDLIVHRLLRERLRSGADPRGGAIRSDDAQPWKEGIGKREKATGKTDRSLPGRSQTVEPVSLSAEELTDIASESSQAERRAAEAERELIEWKKMKFMADRVGDDFKAIILSVTKYGFFVELDELFIEGLVPIISLIGDHYTFRDTDRSICGATTGHCFKPGQRVEVLLDRIDRQQRRLQFALLPGTEPRASTGRGQGSTATSVRKEKKFKTAKPRKLAGKAKRAAPKKRR